MTTHYRIEKAFDGEFQGWLDVDPDDKAEILARLYVRKLLPLDPHQLYVLADNPERLDIRVRSNDCVALFLRPSALGSVQPEADAAQDQEDRQVEGYFRVMQNRADDNLRYLLNELKAIEEAPSMEESLRDRRSIGRRMDWLAVYLDNGGKVPPVKAIIAEAVRLPVQA